MKRVASHVLCFVLCIANASFLRPTGPGANGSHSIPVPIPVLTPPDTQEPAHPLVQNVHTVEVPSLVPATAAPSNMQGWQGDYQHAIAPNVASHNSSIITTPIKMGDTIVMMPARQTFLNGQRIVETFMQPCHMPFFAHAQQAPLAYPPMPVSYAPSEINPPPPAPLTPAPATTPMYTNIPTPALTSPALRDSPQSTASYASINGDTATTSTSFHVWEAGTSWKKGISTFRTPYHLSAEEKKELIENAQSGQYTVEDLSNKFHISYISVYRTAGDITLPKLRHTKMSAEERAAKIKTCVEILKTSPERNVDCLAKDLDIRKTTIKSMMKSVKKHLEQAVQTTAETQTVAATNPATPPQHTTASTKPKRKYVPWEIGTTWQKGVSTFRHTYRLGDKELEDLMHDAKSGQFTCAALSEKFHISHRTIYNLEKKI